MERSVLRREVLPLALLFAALFLAAIVLDALLHRLGLAWIGRYAGIPGVLLIVMALGYSARKRGIVARGAPARWLRVHEVLAWTGALLVLVHAGVHFRAVLPWLALAAMLLNVASGLTGRYLLGRATRAVASRRAHYGAQGLGDEAIDSRLFWDEIALDVMRQWRSVHFPISLAFAVLALGHIGSILLFWGWH